MKARTELLLYRLGWVAGMVLRPTWKSLDSSFESWTYGNGLLRQIQRLEVQGYVETKKDPESGKRLIRLTEKGAAVCRAGADPELRWGAQWDGLWRMVIFDVPEMDRALRAKIRRFLWKEGFGCLQQSVWISPTSFGGMIEKLKGNAVDGSSLTLMEGSPVGGESPEDLVKAAWNFEAINEAWGLLATHLDFRALGQGELKQDGLMDWMAQERRLLRDCLQLDPLFPSALLPDGYMGRQVWAKRGEVLGNLSNDPG